MKYFVHYAAAIFLFALILSSGAAMAQTAGNSLSADTGTTPAQRQMIYSWRQSSQLQQSIAALGATPVAAILMPVLFGVAPSNLTPNFGDPRDNGTRTHEGEDIMAVKGTPIVSPTAAVVILVTTDLTSSEGNAVYTANPGGETFVYYHLDRIGEGVVSGLVIQQGSLIGYVGNTGNAAGGPAHLHFEVHNSAGVPTDPFPRLTAEFTPAQKISFLTTILTQTSDPLSLSQFLVTNFRSTFTADLAANIALPTQITDALASVPIITPPITSTPLPTGDLDVGSSGTAVVALQKYLIQAASGAGATNLSYAGATGYFGVITKTALAEYQLKMGISPANGYYGPATLTFIASHPFVASNPTTGGNTVAPIRDLYYGIIGEDVRTLQKLLNANGYTVATTGGGSVGNETSYFGPATKAAVIKFQTVKNISPAAGYVGPLTRAALASL